MDLQDLKCDLAFFRKKFGVSQKKLAEYCGVSVNTISSIERGEFLPRIDLAIKLCHAFGIPEIRLLFSYDGDKAIPMFEPWEAQIYEINRKYSI